MGGGSSVPTGGGRRPISCSFTAATFVCWVVIALAERAEPARADVLTLGSGAQYEGQIQRIASLGENPTVAGAAASPSGPIILIDDNLRFIFVPNAPDVKYAASPPRNVERVKIPQPVASSSRRVGSVGRALEITPWDDFGRRRVALESVSGRVDIFQGITEITPEYSRVEALRGSPGWDLRMATSSISPEVLRKVLLLAGGGDATKLDARLRIVAMFIQAEMYNEAVRDLAQIRRDFPEMAEKLQDQETRLVQLLAQQLLNDIVLRRDAGQHEHAQSRLATFPEAGVAGELLIQVRDLLQEYDNRRQQYEQVLALVDTHLGQLKDAELRTRLEPWRDELRRELNIHNLDRMADFLRFADDPAMAVDQKLSLAITGYLLGSGAGLENLAIASSMWHVRSLVQKYLRSSLASERQTILEELQSFEGATPANVARILAQLKPPLETQPEPTDVPGLYDLRTKGLPGEEEVRYLVQLPPEYHPARRYPCIVTLNGLAQSERDQIDWWAGPYVPQKSMRLGQAWRRGYIVIAPQWRQPGQGRYEYSLREHAAVLFSLRDACKRISIDTDRVFLSGHFQGGDAAWDIALAHPDLWAGGILFSATADRYVTYYTPNQRHIPLYFVAGEIDLATAASGDWLTENATELNRYLEAPRSDCTVVLYRGRGPDGFSDEIHRIFSWMELPSHRRQPAPTSIKVTAMRPWDNFFWWVEVEDYPANSMVMPHAWPPERGTRATATEAEVVAANGRVLVRPSAARGTVWLSPELVDFSKPVQVSVDGKELRTPVQPNLEVLLEDARTRGERQHPFWAKAQWPDRGPRRDR